MSNITSARRPPRALFFGMQGNFSAPALTALLNDGIEVAAVIVPASPIPGSKPAAIKRLQCPRVVRTMLPLASSSLRSSIVQTAWIREIPVWEVHRLANPETVATLAAYQPDVICVACFSLLIPAVIINLPRLGCLNVHPALLPANRGPVPLFWTFREGHETAGVTIHFMDERMDSGDILAQQSLPLPDGVSYDYLESQSATIGGELLARTVWDLYAGRDTCRPQDETKSSYHSFPTHEDFVVHAASWSARHVFNFINGLGHWDGPIELYAGEQVFFVRDAISYSNNDVSDGPGELYREGAAGVWVRCRVGWVCVETTLM
jgi:methionyl-tRNA formyltransferase